MTNIETLHYGKQSIDEADINAVVETLQSPFITQGPKVAAFEAQLAKQVKAQHAVACSNGTAALHLACLALGVGSGDRLWTSAISFVASANCALYCGAKVEFIDVDPLTANISISALQEKITQAQQTGILPKAIVVVHMAGNPCDMWAIYQLCQPLGIHIIEDAAHALGSTYHEQPIGSCRYSDCCTFSFHPVKSITCGEGGMVTTNDKTLAERLRLLASHGIVKGVGAAKGHPEWYYEQQELGYNYRLSDIHAALGLSQLGKLEQFVLRREQIFARYQSAFQQNNLNMQRQTPHSSSAYHLAILFISGANRDRVYEQLKTEKIFTQLHYMPIYRHPLHDIGSENYINFPGAEHYFQTALSIPIYPTLTDAQQEHVINAINRLLA